MTPKILMIYTGGTIGMIRDAESGNLKAFNFDHLQEHIPELKRLNIDINTVSFENPIDSSAISTEHWEKMGDIIWENYASYDGFVILHGSDTMAFSASALSFMFDGLKKPIIFTGSQLPIGTIRTDGKENLITALQIAATQENGESLVQEVAIYFEYSLYRGNRSTKDSANHFEAFRSPNYPELAVAGVNIEFRKEKLYRPTTNELKYDAQFSNRVALIKLYPGMDFSIYASLFDRKKVDGIVLETFGAGNAPLNDSLKNILNQFISAGGVVLNITQCNSGAVQQGLYETSSMFNEIGVISGGAMTTEAALTKLMKELTSAKNISARLKENLRGELD